MPKKIISSYNNLAKQLRLKPQILGGILLLIILLVITLLSLQNLSNNTDQRSQALESQCGWCGQSCILKTSDTKCPAVAPPAGCNCVADGKGCVITGDECALANPTVTPLPPPGTNPCTETDNGFDYENYGETTGTILSVVPVEYTQNYCKNGTCVDYCVPAYSDPNYDNDFINEWACSTTPQGETGIAFERRICDYGCQNGACLPNPYPSETVTPTPTLSRPFPSIPPDILPLTSPTPTLSEPLPGPPTSAVCPTADIASPLTLNPDRTPRGYNDGETKDCCVDVNDLAFLRLSFQSQDLKADINNDGKVNLWDYANLVTNWHQSQCNYL